MYDIVAVGESLIDFVSRPGARPGSLLFEGNPGGAPANVLACAARLGLRTAFIGKVGNDVFGACLKAAVESGGIDASALVVSDKHPTTLAFVSLDAAGDRSFSFYRRNTADVELTRDEVDFEKIGVARILHFGSVSLTTEPARSATMAAVRYAAERGVTVSYDPNLRERLWASPAEAREVILAAMPCADLVKLSEEELLFLTGDKNMETAMRALYAEQGLSLLVVTLGPGGCLCLCNGCFCKAPTYATACVDTTGAGDAFWGAMLSRVLAAGKPCAEFTEDDLCACISFANASGALTTTKWGAIPALPTEEEIIACMRDIPYLEI